MHVEFVTNATGTNRVCDKCHMLNVGNCDKGHMLMFVSKRPKIRLNEFGSLIFNQGTRKRKVETARIMVSLTVSAPPLKKKIFLLNVPNTASFVFIFVLFTCLMQHKFGYK